MKSKRSIKRRPGPRIKLHALPDLPLDKPGQGKSNYCRNRLPDDDNRKVDAGAKIPTMLARHINLACEKEKASSKSKWIVRVLSEAAAKSLGLKAADLIPTGREPLTAANAGALEARAKAIAENEARQVARAEKLAARQAARAEKLAARQVARGETNSVGTALKARALANRLERTEIQAEALRVRLAKFGPT